MIDGCYLDDTNSRYAYYNPERCCRCVKGECTPRKYFTPKQSVNAMYKTLNKKDPRYLRVLEEGRKMV